MDTQIYNDVILLSGLRNAIAIDYLMTSSEEGMMFFTNQEFQSKILSAHLNGTGEDKKFNPAPEKMSYSVLFRFILRVNDML